MGYCVQDFGNFQGYWLFRKKYGEICLCIRDTCMFTSVDIGYMVSPMQHLVSQSLNVRTGSQDMSKNDNSILSVRRAVKVQTSLRNYAQSRQKLYISYTSRGILRLKLRHLVRLERCACFL